MMLYLELRLVVWKTFVSFGWLSGSVLLTRSFYISDVPLNGSDRQCGLVVRALPHKCLDTTHDPIQARAAHWSPYFLYLSCFQLWEMGLFKWCGFFVCMAKADVTLHLAMWEKFQLSCPLWTRMMWWGKKSAPVLDSSARPACVPWLWRLAELCLLIWNSSLQFFLSPALPLLAIPSCACLSHCMDVSGHLGEQHIPACKTQPNSCIANSWLGGRAWLEVFSLCWIAFQPQTSLLTWGRTEQGKKGQVCWICKGDGHLQAQDVKMLLLTGLKTTAYITPGWCCWASPRIGYKKGEWGLRNSFREGEDGWWKWWGGGMRVAIMFRVEEEKTESAPLQPVRENGSTWVGRPLVSSRDAWDSRSGTLRGPLCFQTPSHPHTGQNGTCWPPAAEMGTLAKEHPGSW